jgi:prevent-host-death family protein
MREIGVRELKRSLSETLRAVGRGEQVRVTLRGRPLADIVPAGAAAADDRMRRLVVEGRVVPPARSRPRRAPKLARARRSATSLVLSERDAER